jgi:hypothetical protein
MEGTGSLGCGFVTGFIIVECHYYKPFLEEWFPLFTKRFNSGHTNCM